MTLEYLRMTTPEIIQALLTAVGGFAGLLALADRVFSGRPRAWFDCVDVSGFGQTEIVLAIKNTGDQEIVVEQIIFNRDEIGWMATDTVDEAADIIFGDPRMLFVRAKQQRNLTLHRLDRVMIDPADLRVSASIYWRRTDRTLLKGIPVHTGSSTAVLKQMVNSRKQEAKNTRIR